MTAKSSGSRLLALDILRGITIAGMILVNNPGSWGHIYAPLRHAEWHGLTPTDLVFPFFMFIMGVSTYMSLRKYDFKLSWPAFRKIIKRTVLIFFIGWVLTWLAGTLRRWSGDYSFVEAAWNFENMRLLGVLPRLAICYGVGATLALALGRKALAWTVAGILVAYSILMLGFNGLVFSEDNIIGVVDRAVLGVNHMYAETIDGVTIKFDPEGLLSTIPSIAHMLIGFLCGSMLMAVTDNRDRINRLFILGTILTFAGLLLSYGMPINKKIWSPTFVLTTCGLASSLLGLLIWIIDMRGHRRWCRFFQVFGVNPLFLFCLGSIGGVILSVVRFGYDGGTISIHNWYYRVVCIGVAGGDAVLGSLLYALSYIALVWVFGYILFKKKIYIKI